MRCADEDICIMKQLLDAPARLVAVQRHTGKGLEYPPVVAPTPPPDDIQCRARKPLRVQRAGYPCRRDEMFSRLHCSERYAPQRPSIAFGAFRRFAVEHVADWRPVEGNRGVGPALGCKRPSGVAGLVEKQTIALQPHIQKGNTFK